MAQGSAAAWDEASTLVEWPAAPVAVDAFRDAMAMLASGVAVVTCWEGETPRGLLVSSITALSTEPPRMLFCVRKAASSHNALFRSRRCAVAILAEPDQREAERFSRTDLTHERFDPALWLLDQAAPPRLKSALIGLEGTISSRIDAGTHTVFILNVAEVQVSPGRPLVYFDRDFRSLDWPEQMAASLESLSGVTVWTGAAGA